MIAGISLQEASAELLMGVGTIFLLGSLIGMLRLPDFYSRVHASGNSETLGVAFVLLGLAVCHGFSITAAKLLLISLLLFIGNPIASHILAKAAYRTGLPVWTRQNPIGDTPEEEKNEGKEPVGHADLHH